MMTTKTSVGLSLTIVIATLVFACQSEEIQDNRRVIAGETAKPVTKEDDAKSEDKKVEAPAGNPSAPGGAPPPASANYTMTWGVSADPAIVSYKVFIVPPDRNPRFPGKTDVPIQIKNYPIAGLQKNGDKYSVVVSNDEIKAALGATVVSPTAYCFSIVAVNGVGNSTYAPVICP